MASLSRRRCKRAGANCGEKYSCAVGSNVITVVSQLPAHRVLMQVLQHRLVPAVQTIKIADGQGTSPVVGMQIV